MTVPTRFTAPMMQVAAALLGVAVDVSVSSYADIRQQCAAGAPVAFVGANVLTMLDSVPLQRQTVLVRDGKIAAIGTPALPNDVCRVDATGKFLVPGLADMHAHMTESDLPLFLANGVTTVREMNGSPPHVVLRTRLANGELMGPRLIVGSPLMTGKPLQYRHRLITNAAEATAAAHDAKAAGYEFIKIYDDLSLESYDAFVKAGKSLGLPLDGHVPQAVGLEHVLASGQNIQHLDKIVFALGGHTVDTAAIDGAGKLFVGRGTWVTPTLASLRALDIAGTPEYAARFRQPEMTYVDSGTIGWWRSMVRTGDRVYTPSRFYRLETRLVPVLRAAGVRFLLGTDASNPLMIAGFSVHEELATLVREGHFTSYQALQSATSSVGEFLGDSTIGVVRVGARADLLLVTDNPLVHLATLQRASGVMAAGRWFTRERLDAALSAAVKSSLPR